MKVYVVVDSDCDQGGYLFKEVFGTLEEAENYIKNSSDVFLEILEKTLKIRKDDENGK